MRSKVVGGSRAGQVLLLPKLGRRSLVLVAIKVALRRPSITISFQSHRKYGKDCRRTWNSDNSPKTPLLMSFLTVR